MTFTTPLSLSTNPTNGSGSSPLPHFMSLGSRGSRPNGSGSSPLPHFMLLGVAARDRRRNLVCDLL